MKSTNRLVYSIASIFAVVSVCTALPINVASSEHASELMIGLLALLCISVTILACTCCHRNKSGFEEFENENTIVDQTNSSSRSEFPIFRAISPLNSSNNPENNLENRILSNIVNQNQMNRTFNEFENSQNNNGPISVVDMENIQNNNAMNYIPNRNEIRNEINIQIEPSPNSINRNLIEVNHMITNTTTSTNSNEMPHLADFQNVASGSNQDPYYQLISDDDQLPSRTFEDAVTVSESLNNYIDFDDNAEDTQPEPYLDTESNSQFELKDVAQSEYCHKVDVKGNACASISQQKIHLESNLADDDAISVEEALRALDFAISGGESIFSDYQDDSSSNESDVDDEHGNDDIPSQVDVALESPKLDSPKKQIETEFTHVDLINTVNAKDKFSENAEIGGENSAEHSREHVYEVAKELVDSVLEECTTKIASLAGHSSADEPSRKSQIDEPATASNNINANESIAVCDLDDSLEETFVIGKLEASTPCHKTHTNCPREKNQLGINLFETLTEVNESALSGDGVVPMQASQSQIAYTTFDIQPTAQPLATTFVKNDDATFVAENQLDVGLQETFNIDTKEVKPQNDVPKIHPIIKIDKEEVNSDDLTTITPMNTPIELNYVGETWDQFVSKSMNKKSIDLQEKSTDAEVNVPVAEQKDSLQHPWFLHKPQSNDTFNMNDVDYSNYDGMDEDSVSVEENPELLSLTFDALRKQLADVLPQASVRPSVDYSDDEENASDSDPDCENIEYYNRLENPKSEVVINYKQQLSPILEESEDETCKTFVLNETKCLDSTSTGCIETSEAIMGVTKVLMASNDTLFNFEDTLGDRDDMLSPRVNSGGSTANATTPQPDNCKTPTNEAYLQIYPVEYKPVDATNDAPLIAGVRPNTLQLNSENLTNNLSDLLSPEQQKTFSEEINTIEQLSSDLSGTIDATNTLDDLKTCISVHLMDDTNNSKMENYNADTLATEQQKTQALIANESSVETEVVELPSAEQRPQSPRAVEPIQSNTPSKSPIESDLNSIEPNENAIENRITNPNELDKSDDVDDTFETNQINGSNQSEQSELNVLRDSVTPLSGEEDPWATHPITDIRFSGPYNDDVMQHNARTFATNDWDSDIEDSNSSEEFVYAQGTSQIGEYLRSTQNTTFPLSTRNHIDLEDDESISASQPIKSCKETGDEQPDTQDIWNSHEDLIAVTTNVDLDSADDILDESSNSENENEWVPSSWDHLAKPIRSAMKSPDKSSSKTGTKSRRSVVFKKQSYQSVYEYPKENASLSPTVVEPQAWAQYLVNSSPFSSTMNGTHMIDENADSNGEPLNFNALDGFAVSSSSRPFHLNQFPSECHTWPTDPEPFSWSQIENDKAYENNDINCAAESIEWPSNFKRNVEPLKTANEIRDLKSPNSINRPDSGVGEPAELLSESISLGELCHTKSSLRLPLNVYSVNSIPVEKEVAQQVTPAEDQNESSKSISQNDYSENVVASDSMDSIVPDPTSCTGSMDSINSFDGGKISQNHLSNSTNADGLLINATETNRVSNQTAVQNDITNTSKKCDYRTTANRQSDSTDEDSGIENIVRVTKEI